MKTLKESIQETLEIMLDTISCKEPEGITTGYPKFDNLVRGMSKGTLTVLASRPSLGKTSFALNIVKNRSEHTLETGILFCSDLSRIELTSRLLTIASGVQTRFNRNYPPAEINSLTDEAKHLKDYPLFFEEHTGVDAQLLRKIEEFHAEHDFDLLIMDNVRSEDCQKLKVLAKDLNIAVLALVSIHSKKDEVLNKIIADALIVLHRDRNSETDPDLGARVELLIVKNNHGCCGTCPMYFLPQIMLFKESNAGDCFVAIPETYEAISPYEELKKYLAPEKLPLHEHLCAEMPKDGETLNLSDVLSLSACLEAIGDHENAVKAFITGRKYCQNYEEKSEVIYDWMFAAMYYWLFRDMSNAMRCMDHAKLMLDKQTEKEFQELERRMKTYVPADWIKDDEIEPENPSGKSH